jgi:radical SAM protein with 4Fe4S-binding SPASM domain
MPSNFDRLADIAAAAKLYDAPLRINVYQPVRTDKFALTYEQYWSGFERLFAATDVIAIGEPLVRAMAGLPLRRGGCGVATVRVTPRATVQPCVYWPGGGAPLDILLDAGADVVDTPPFADARSVPEACRGCAHLAACGGGCAGRRRLLGALGEPDPYCPIVRGEERRLSIRQAAAREMPKLESACTTIVIARD